MSFMIGKVTRKVSKQHNEYFVGRICITVRGAWSKKGKDDLCLFLDTERINFLAEKNKSKPDSSGQEANKQQQ